MKSKEGKRKVTRFSTPEGQEPITVRLNELWLELVNKFNYIGANGEVKMEVSYMLNEGVGVVAVF